jgi:hypothetical protein
LQYAAEANARRTQRGPPRLAFSYRSGLSTGLAETVRTIGVMISSM